MVPDSWLKTVMEHNYLPEQDVIQLCNCLMSKLVLVPNVVSVGLPVNIVGDIHGQFFDLIQLFKIGGDIPSSSYVFLGDYVDRGYYSVETITLLFCLLLKYPDHITLLRGNHETREISRIYGFYDECLNKYGNSTPYKFICQVFDVLPIVALVDQTIVCVHGGLSPDIDSLHKIMSLERNIEIPVKGPLADLVWSDPTDETDNWGISPRGAGWLYGKNIVEIFFHSNNLSMICRSHQLVQDGFLYMFGGKLASVWSAPNYCYRCGNLASIFMLNSDGSKVVRTFEAAPSEDRIVPGRSPAPYFL